MTPARSLLLVALASGLLAGCGGGGKGTPSDATPKITVSPQSVVAEVGGTATFSVTATGRDLTYQWSKDGTPLPGATAATFSIAAVTAADFGGYTVIVSSGAKSTNATASLIQKGAPAITTDPQSIQEVAGRSVVLTVAATGDDPLAYQWTKNGTAVPGATSATYTIPALAATDEGAYAAIVSNAKGHATSAVATVSIIVEETPRITLGPATQAVAVGSPATFGVQATGGALTYQWKKDGSPIAGATSSTYTIPTVATGDDGSYAVVVSNDKGSATSDAATLTVLVPPSITTDPASQAVNSGAPVTFTVAASGSNLAYQWTKGGKAISGATGASFAIAVATASDAGDYAVVVSNAVGRVTSETATLTVRIPPAIVNGPTLVVTSSGATVSVVASGTAPLAYQWLRNGTPVQGATGASYTIGHVNSSNSGLYSVVVSNGAGSVTSGTVAVLSG